MRKSTHTAEYAALCRLLKATREAAGLTQRDLAARLKVPHSVVAKLETGERRMDVIEFCRFVRACDAEPVAAFTSIAGAAPSRSKGGRR